MKRQSIFFLLIVFVISGKNHIVCDEITEVYRIQVYANQDKAAVESFGQQLVSQNYAPVVVRQQGEWWKVKIGEFRTYADALYYKKALRSGAFYDAFISKDELTSPVSSVMSLTSQNLKIEPLFKDAIARQWKPITSTSLMGTELSTLQYQPPVVSAAILAADNTTLSEDDLYNKALSYSQKEDSGKAKETLLTFLQRFPASEKVADAKLRLAYWNLKVGADTEAENAFLEVKQNHAQQEEAGEAALRIGYLKLRNKDKAAALSEFEAVAQGEITASDETRLEAMIRCAKIYHAAKDRVKALQAFRECAEVADRTRYDSTTHLAIAGLYMELARSGVGTLDDCISECNTILSVIDLPNNIKATAMQMKAECFYFQKDYDRALSQAKEILEKTPDVKTMCMLADFYSGLSYLGKRYYYEAVRSFDKVINNYSDKDNLPGNDLRLSSLLYKGKSYLLMGDTEKAKGICISILKDYPQSKEAGEANNLLGAIQ